MNKHILFFKTTLLLLIGIFTAGFSYSQILTSSPYSRYGLGELNLPTFATPSAMGGSFIAYQHDSTTTPLFINAANPAGLAGLRFTTLELGGQSQFTKISDGSTSLKKRNLNFSYASLGFPIKKIGGAAAFGIMPYSSVGYNINSTQEVTNIGTVNYRFDGLGGLNKAFIACGIKPFRKQLIKFYHSAYHDTLVKHKKTAKYKFVRFTRELASELSVGVNAAYLFGNIIQTTRVIYPGSITYFNSLRQRSIQVNDFIFNGGLQTHFSIDSVRYHGKDPLKQGHRRILKEKIRIGFGFFAAIPSGVSSKQSNIIYTYSLDGVGVETPKDTLLNSQNVHGSVRLPLETGFGLSIKKGERLTVLMDAATTNWSGYKYFGEKNSNFTNSYRLSAGLNYVPNRLAYNSYVKRVQYRLGVSYTNGYLDLKNTKISNYALTAGLGLPVGLGRAEDIAVVNITAQFGTIGTVTNSLIQEKYIRLIVGFTFNNRWFKKFKYD